MVPALQGEFLKREKCRVADGCEGSFRRCFLKPTGDQTSVRESKWRVLCVEVDEKARNLINVFDQLSNETEGVAFGMVDVDENSDASLDFEISAVPTFVFLNGEKAVDRMAGADANQLLSKVNDLKTN